LECVYDFIEYSYQFHSIDVLCYCKLCINGCNEHCTGITETKLVKFCLELLANVVTIVAETKAKIHNVIMWVCIVAQMFSVTTNAVLNELLFCCTNTMYLMTFYQLMQDDLECVSHYCLSPWGLLSILLLPVFTDQK